VYTLLRLQHRPNCQKDPTGEPTSRSKTCSARIAIACEQVRNRKGTVPGLPGRHQGYLRELQQRDGHSEVMGRYFRGRGDGESGKGKKDQMSTNNRQLLHLEKIQREGKESDRTTVFDPLSRLVIDAVRAALEESGKPLRNRLMTLDKAAEYMGVSSDTLQRLHAAGKIQCVRIMDRRLLFDVNDLDGVIDNSKG
jgi:excisionase family DNA binding protein